MIGNDLRQFMNIVSESYSKPVNLTESVKSTLTKSIKAFFKTNQKDEGAEAIDIIDGDGDGVLAWKKISTNKADATTAQELDNILSDMGVRAGSRFKGVIKDGKGIFWQYQFDGDIDDEDED